MGLLTESRDYISYFVLWKHSCNASIFNFLLLSAGCNSLIREYDELAFNVSVKGNSGRVESHAAR